MRGKLEHHVDREADSVRYYRLCIRCRHAIRVCGSGHDYGQHGAACFLRCIKKRRNKRGFSTMVDSIRFIVVNNIFPAEGGITHEKAPNEFSVF